jgi:integrase/recombinase XerD
MPHDFRRAFALIMLRNGVDIFALQKLMGHSELQVGRHYLVQTDEDVHMARMLGSPPSMDGKSYPGDSARIVHIK